MGKRGPRPLPIQTKLARGTYRGKLDQTPGFDPLADLKPPAELGEAGKRKWIELRPILTQAGVLTVADREAFALLCRTYDELAKLDRVLAKEGEYQTARTGFKAPHPALHQRQKWLDTRRRLLESFGLTPSARGSVTIAKPRLGIIPRQRKAD